MFSPRDILFELAERSEARSGFDSRISRAANGGVPYGSPSLAHQAQGEDILAKGEIPVCSGAFVRKAHDWVRIRRSEIGERLAQQDILQAESVRIFTAGEIPVI